VEEKVLFSEISDSEILFVPNFGNGIMQLSDCGRARYIPLELRPRIRRVGRISETRSQEAGGGEPRQ
jgi:hypothetical protein